MVQGQRQLMIVGKNVELLNESKIAPIVLLLLASLCCNSLESICGNNRGICMIEPWY